MKRKIKVLHVLHSLNVGGMENCLVNIINAGDAERFEHAICCISSDGPMRQRITRPVPVFNLNKGAGSSNLLSLKIARIVASFRPDVVHTRNWGAVDGIVGAWLAGTRTVIHDERGRDALDPSGANRRRQVIRRLLAPLITRYVTVSGDLASWLVQEVSVPAHKVLQIANGVDSARFCPSRDQLAMRSELGIPHDAFVVGTVGRLDPVKDFSTLIRAFQMACASGDSSRLRLVLVLVGAGPEEALLKSLVQSLGLAGQVVFTGARRDIPALLQVMDLFVLSSIAEGIPNTVLEAMATGLPVIATDVGGVGEIVADGATGWLVRPRDPEAIAEKVACYLEDDQLLRLHGRQGRRRAEELFSLQAMVDKYQALYESVTS